MVKKLTNGWKGRQYRYKHEDNHTIYRKKNYVTDTLLFMIYFNIFNVIYNLSREILLTNNLKIINLINYISIIVSDKKPS